MKLNTITIILILNITVLPFLLKAQDSSDQKFKYKSKRVEIQKGKPVQPDSIKKDYEPKMEKVAPAPGGEKTENWLDERKKQIVKPAVKDSGQTSPKRKKKSNASGSLNKPLLKFSSEGNFENIGIPCDNDIAISNDGILISVINSNIMAFDTELDSLLFSVSLEAFADTLGLTANMYDPKAIYDPTENRFIMVWLSGNTDSTSNIVVAFSTDADPRKPWHLYALPGDPVQDGTWSDFPSVAITKDELFISINALVNDTLPPSQIDSWKFLFKETGLWQINKESGYTGQNLDTRYWNEFFFDNKAIRNLYPVKGGFDVKGPDIFFLSNRSFELENDTIYLAYLNSTLDDPNVGLSLDVIKANPSYGLAPDAIQPNGRALQTNDARVLGAFLENGRIHYVQNTVLRDSATASVYHGIISDVYNNPSIEGHIFQEGIMEFGYPNISFSGLSKYDEQAIISFNHVSTDTFAGFSAYFYKAGEGYSERLRIKNGTGTVGGIGQPKYRWGDYSGSQKRYNKPGEVWLAGYYVERGALSGTNRAWVSAVQSPDSSFDVGIQISANEVKAKLFPNPIENRFNVEFELEKSQEIEIALFNINGQLVQVFWRDGLNSGKHNFSFNTRDLSSGQYILKAQNAATGTSIFTKKIIHQ